jgi:hypothetical protein
VHLPAERLFPGREDVVLLVVDPARLHTRCDRSPVVPGDPASMRFPHLYGPLPTSAAVAVVRWRPSRPAGPAGARRPAGPRPGRWRSRCPPGGRPGCATSPAVCGGARPGVPAQP